MDFCGRHGTIRIDMILEAVWSWGNEFAFRLGDSSLGSTPMVFLGSKKLRTAAGRVVPELGEAQVRERFLYSYRLIYEVRPERIEVLAILHGRRLLESIDERFKG